MRGEQRLLKIFSPGGLDGPNAPYCAFRLSASGRGPPRDRPLGRMDARGPARTPVIPSRAAWNAQRSPTLDRSPSGNELWTVASP